MCFRGFWKQDVSPLCSPVPHLWQEIVELNIDPLRPASFHIWKVGGQAGWLAGNWLHHGRLVPEGWCPESDARTVRRKAVGSQVKTNPSKLFSER